MSNEIFSHTDMLPTLLAAAGEPDIVEKLKKGHKAGNKTFKVHIDGYNLLPYWKGEVKANPRKGFFYWSDDGDHQFGNGLVDFIQGEELAFAQSGYDPSRSTTLRAAMRTLRPCSWRCWQFGEWETARVTMRKLKEVLRLHSLGLSQHQIARNCIISQSAVLEYVSAAEAAKWPLPENWCGRAAKSANKLLTRDPETVRSSQYIVDVCC